MNPFESPVQFNETTYSPREAIRTVVIVINVACSLLVGCTSLYSIVRRESFGAVFNAIIVVPPALIYSAFEVFASVRKNAANERVLGGLNIAAAAILALGFIASVVEMLSTPRSDTTQGIIPIVAAIGGVFCYLLMSGVVRLSYAKYIEKVTMPDEMISSSDSRIS